MSAEPHTLTLKSQRVDKARREMLYRATCSCGWKLSYSITATGARREHAEHVQQFLGPEAQERRLDGE